MSHRTPAWAEPLHRVHLSQLAGCGCWGKTEMAMKGKNTISTFELFELFPDQEAARIYLGSQVCNSQIYGGYCDETFSERARELSM